VADVLRQVSQFVGTQGKHTFGALFVGFLATPPPNPASRFPVCPIGHLLPLVHVPIVGQVTPEITAISILLSRILHD